jgi:hypothetical protein
VRRAHGDLRIQAMVAVLVAGVVLGLLTQPWRSTVIILVFTLFFVGFVEVLLRTSLDSGFSPWRISAWRIALSIAAIGLMTFFLFDDKPWLPAEKMELRGRDSLVGYVLNQTDSELVVLTYEAREVIRVDLDDVQSREICQRTRGGQLFKIAPK